MMQWPRQPRKKQQKRLQPNHNILTNTTIEQMNKILNINLGGFPFTIDDNAFVALENYMNTIKRHFTYSEGCDEIMLDIESRIAELFMDILKGRQIISQKDVDQVMAIMGRPEEFGGEPIEEEKIVEDKKSFQGEHKGAKRLYRDKEAGKMAGVCAGLSAYLGIEDPVWIRLIFIVSVLAGGIGGLVYIALWVAIPEAKSSADRLAMKGEKINIQNIASTIENEINKLSDTINEMTRDFEGKKKV